MNATDRAEILRLTEQGVSQTEIARRLKCSNSTVCKYLARARLEARARPPQKPYAGPTIPRRSEVITDPQARCSAAEKAARERLQGEVRGLLEAPL